MNCEIVILAGGGSTRLGRDKATIELGGITILERITGEASKTGCLVKIVGRERPQNWTVDAVSFLPDTIPSLGPMGGLRTALESTAYEAVLLLPCDAPLLTRVAIGWLLQQAADTETADGIAVRRHGNLEPLFAVYSTRCLARVNEMLENGDRALNKLLRRGSFIEVDAPDYIAHELVNYNTAEEWSDFLEQSV